MGLWNRWRGRAKGLYYVYLSPLPLHSSPSQIGLRSDGAIVSIYDEAGQEIENR